MPGETMAGVLLFFPSYNQIYLHFWTNICMRYLVVLSFFPLDLVLYLKQVESSASLDRVFVACENPFMLMVSEMSKWGSKALLGTPDVWVSQTGKIPTFKRLSCPVKPILRFSLFWLLMWGSNSVPTNSRTCTGRVCQSALPFSISDLVAQQDEKTVDAFAICLIKPVLKPTVDILVENTVYLKLSSLWMGSSTFLFHIF